MKLRARARLAWALGGLHVPEAVFALRRRGGPLRLAVLNYHRVAEPAAESDADADVIDATPEEFEWQVGLLKRHFTIVALDDLLAFREGAELPPNPALVTFDDGYRDTLAQAVPVLRRHGVRATFFIATAYVQHRRLFWWDRISWTVKHARRPLVRLDHPAGLAVDLTRPDAARRLHHVVKRHHGLDLERFLRDLAAAAEAPWEPPVEGRLVERLVMTWDDVRGLRRAGMDVGSHTRTHRVLQTVPLGELADELQGSKADLEAQLGEPVSAIAYPVGPSVTGDPPIRDAVRAAGYRLGFSYGNGLQSLRSFDPLDVHRVALDTRMSRAQFRVLLAAPALAG